MQAAAEPEGNVVRQGQQRRPNQKPYVSAAVAAAASLLAKLGTQLDVQTQK